MKNLQIIILLFSTIIYSQNPVLNVHMNDGTVNNFQLSNIDSITFTTGGGTSWTPCPGVPTVNYDGKTYNTVLIGSQCWLKENLDVGTQITGYNDDRENPQTDNGTIEKYCYLDDSENCTKYGGLYQWEEATKYYDYSNLDCNENYDLENVQGICPDGWHLPNMNDFETLAESVNDDGNALREIGQPGDATNTSGFSALLGGRYYHQNGYDNYSGMLEGASFIGVTLTLSINCAGGFKYISLGRNDFIWRTATSLSVGQAVRCIKD